MKEGVVKFLEKREGKVVPLTEKDISEIEKWRKIVHKKGLIGHDPLNKVGFGNLSLAQDFTNLYKTKQRQFIISGSQTGHLQDLMPSHYTRVLYYDLRKFEIITNGEFKASSESITHAAFYEANSQIKAIVHAHHNKLWEKLISIGSPATSKEIEYGTNELALAVKKLVFNNNQGHLVTIGHEGGIFAYGENLETATKLLLDLVDKNLNS